MVVGYSCEPVAKIKNKEINMNQKRDATTVVNIEITKEKKTCTEFLFKIPKGIDRKKYIGITFVSSQTLNQNNC